MKIELCAKSVEKHGAGLVSALREREHTPIVKDCLNRCPGCQLGLVIATVEGSPMSARTAEAFLADVDELAAEDL